jgi:putative PIG3 family NAD(P)H quinone oxidoreductase
MRAARYHGAGGGEVIALEDVPAPEPGSDEALVEVAYAGLNRADVLERMGRYPSPGGPNAIPGMEYSGIVRAVGASVRGLAPGARVCGLTGAGAHAEFLSVTALTTIPVAPGLSLRDAAAIPEAFTTAYDALFARGHFALGQTVLVHAVGSSVGLAAAALAKAAGGHVLATSRSPGKLERAAAHGVDAGIVLDDAWSDAVRAASGPNGVDCILDFVGPATLEPNLRVLAVGGRIVQIGSLGGSKATCDLGLLMSKRATYVGTTLRTRPLDEKIALAKAFARLLMPLFGSGALRAEVDRVVPLAQLAEAHRAMEANENFGKIVLSVAPQLD